MKTTKVLFTLCWGIPVAYLLWTLYQHIFVLGTLK